MKKIGVCLVFEIKNHVNVYTMSWVTDVHGPYYSDNIGYYKREDQDCVSDFESDPDFDYDAKRRLKTKRSMSHNYYQHHDIARPSRDVLMYERKHRHKFHPHDRDMTSMQNNDVEQQLLNQSLLSNALRANPQSLTEEQKQFIFGNALDQKDFQSIMKLITVISVGAMGLVGLKILASFIVDMSK
ncbi:MAG: hypothetical protein PHN45_08795 [Methylococcales bacterium]|nr:hypothetical protein [Methylococcales bacterium]